MSAPVADALLIAVAIAYLAGAVLVVSGLAKVLITWSTARRVRRAEPVDATLNRRAAAAMAAVAQVADVAAPATDVVAFLGAPTGAPERVVGDGWLAVTRFRTGHPATVVFAQAALTGLSDSAVQSLAAHDLLTAPTGAA